MTNYEHEIKLLNQQIIKLTDRVRKFRIIGLYRNYLNKKIIKLVQQRNELFKQWREQVRKNNPELLISSKGVNND